MTNSLRLLLLASLLLSTTACHADSLLEALQTDLGHLKQQMTTQKNQLEQLGTTATNEHQLTAGLTERLRHAQEGQADLSLRLNQLAADARALKGQADTTDRSLERVGAQVKETGDRLSRVEFSTAQASMMAQEATSLSQLTSRSATTAMQSMADQINAAIADLQTRISGAGSPTPKATIEPSRAGREPAATPRQGPNRPPTPPAPAVPLATPRGTLTTPNGQPTAPATSSLRTIVPRQTPPAPATTPDAAFDPDASYHLALIAFNEQRYADAIAVLTILLREAPDHPLAPLALYWLGETYYAQQQYPEAGDALTRFLERHPSAPKAPAALLKLALIAQATGHPSDAKSRFNSLTAKFPGSLEATIAKTLLGQLPD